MKLDALKKVWYFIWYDDSLLSWVINVLLAFIIVKFIIYPLLGLLFGTTHPLVAVVSCSMEHNIDFENWWKTNKGFYEKINITKENFNDLRFKNGINQGDIMVLKNGKNVNIGDVIVFKGQSSNPIIHRIIKLNPVTTKGDNNLIEDRTTGEIIGKAIFRVPYLGWIKITFNGLIGQKIIKC